MLDPNDVTGGEGGEQPPVAERPLRLPPSGSSEQMRLSASPTPAEGSEPEYGEEPPPPMPPPELPPSEHFEPTPPAPPPVPPLPAWERLDEIGFFSALFLTIKQVLLEPDEVFTRMPREETLGRPLLFVVILETLGTLITTAYTILWQVHPLLAGASGKIGGENPFDQLLKRYGIEGIAPGPTEFALLQIIGLALAPIWIIIWAFIWAGIVHLCLMLFNGANHGFAVTFRTLCYVKGAAAVFALIPVYGVIPIGLVWSVVCSVVGLRKTQEISGGKAAAAVLLPSLLCCCCLVAGAMGMLGILQQIQAAAGK